ncbi:hypothetical protein cypCar_00047203, partial [Cyprinus carpio]
LWCLDVFQLVGFGLVALGMWLRFGAETRGFFDIDMKTTQFNIGVMVLVVTGVLMLLVAIIGDCGACNNSKAALGVVSDELVNFYATIYAQYVNTNSPSQAVTLKLFHNAVRYTHTLAHALAHAHAHTRMHTHTHMCGLTGVCLFQFDCCGVGGAIEMLVRDTCPKGSFMEKLMYSSCLGAIKEFFDANAPLVLGGFLGTAGIMLVALVCSSVLYSSLKPSYYSSPNNY